MQNIFVERLKGVAFNIILFLAATFLFYMAGQFQYDMREGQLGPGFWPRILLGFVIVLTLYDIVIGLARGNQTGQVKGMLKTDQGYQEDQEAGDGLLEPENKRHLHLLLIGGAMTLGYVIMIGILGFPICTFLFLVGFMYAGRYRRHGVIWISSLVGTIFLVFLFIKVVYVSLPTGVFPFEGITLTIYSLLGIN